MATMRVLSELPKKDWVVEFAKRDEQGRVVFAVLGKVFTDESVTELTDEQLEDAWGLMNYGPACIEPALVFGDTYGGYLAYTVEPCMVYIPFKNKSCVNDEILIREHYNFDKCYWLANFNRTQSDVWQRGDHNTALGYFRQYNRFIH